jgi:hypothetical protein
VHWTWDGKGSGSMREAEKKMPSRDSGDGDGSQRPPRSSFLKPHTAAKSP